MKRIPQSYAAIGYMLFGLFVAIILVYRLGAGGLRIGHGGQASFDRQFDVQLYKVDEKRALQIAKDGTLSLVEYTKSCAPFNVLCGSYKTSVTGPMMSHFKNGWLYTKYPEFAGTDAYNTITHQAFSIDVPRPPLGQNVDYSTIDIYREQNLTVDPQTELMNKTLKKNFKKLSTCNESCIVITSAFILLIGLWVIVLPFVMIFSRKQSRPK